MEVRLRPVVVARGFVGAGSLNRFHCRYRRRSRFREWLVRNAEIVISVTITIVIDEYSRNLSGTIPSADTLPHAMERTLAKARHFQELFPEVAAAAKICAELQYQHEKVSTGTLTRAMVLTRMGIYLRRGGMGLDPGCYCLYVSPKET